MSVPSLSISTASAILNEQSDIVIEHESFSTSSSTRPCSPSSESSTGGLDGELDFDQDIDSDDSFSPNLKFSFEDWHTPFNTPCQVEFDEEDGAQVVLIPSSSPFFNAPTIPQINQTFSASFKSQSSHQSLGLDCSAPSVCPTLSSKFDLLHSHSPLSQSPAYGLHLHAQSTAETVIVVDSESVLDDSLFPRSIHLIRSAVDKTIPDFPEDSGLASAI
ncbi:hypothetical protein P691DRAFT_225234 [Macrolepiota fuliginosa MF-IS2]|uniref:Uncharacterized protein n=1 Tax=Macrolepiota fuliginosa MF-IS2 TaxID=1400762 RepID=A0A9P6BZD4_9AGAR|nr:hypothetical protein P691DRAFT_225234 [Macrolepiota fuliginosa MF-IS2]